MTVGSIPTVQQTAVAVPLKFFRRNGQPNRKKCYLGLIYIITAFTAIFWIYRQNLKTEHFLAGYSWVLYSLLALFAAIGAVAIAANFKRGFFPGYRQTLEIYQDGFKVSDANGSKVYNWTDVKSLTDNTTKLPLDRFFDEISGAGPDGDFHVAIFAWVVVIIFLIFAGPFHLITTAAMNYKLELITNDDRHFTFNNDYDDPQELAYRLSQKIAVSE